MIGNQLVGENLTRVPFQTVGKNPFERIIVLRLVENGGAGIATIQVMVDATGFICTFRSSLRGILALRTALKRVLTPFAFPLLPFRFQTRLTIRSKRSSAEYRLLPLPVAKVNSTSVAGSVYF